MFNHLEIANCNITIVGLGLIGGSMAMALQGLNCANVWAVDINENVLHDAEKSKIISKGYLDPGIPLPKSDIVIMCLYPDLTVKFIKDNICKFRTGTIITDTAGIKSKLINEITAIVGNDLDFIGGHPMAGREGSGYAQAAKNMFKGASYIITPTPKNREENILAVEKLVRAIGFKEVVRLNPQVHDQIIAYTSHLPHIIASALINCNQNNTRLIAAGSFKDATRVAIINSKLWSELILSNRNNILRQIDGFTNSLADFRNAIANNDAQSLITQLEQGRKGKEALMRDEKTGN